MASQQTPNYKLSRWAGTDRILMEEFNDNWDKIDTALKERSCRFYTETYEGDGETTKTWTFPAKPIMVMIVCSNNVTIMLRSANTGIAIYGSINYSFPHGEWTDNSITVTFSEVGRICNVKTITYGLFAILET